MSGNETELEPWYKRVKGPFPERYGCVGVKEDGGGSMRGRGTVGAMRVHRATFNRNAALVRELCANGEDVNEVDGAGSTPIMCVVFNHGRRSGALLRFVTGGGAVGQRRERARTSRKSDRSHRST